MKKVNWLSILVYLFMLGGVSALGVFFAVEWRLDPALTVLFIFAVLGLVAYALYLRDGGRGWLVVAVLGGLAALLTFSVFLAVTGILHPAILSALYAFAAAGGLLYLMDRRRDARPAERDKPAPR